MDLKFLIIGIAFFVIVLLEGRMPFFRNRTGRLRHALPHLLTAMLNGLLTRFALAGLTIGAIGWAQNGPMSFLYAAPADAGGRTVLAFVLFDLWMYAWHRMNHRIALLWRFHRAHHADTDMDATTALRFHPGELVLSALARLPAIMLLGMSLGQVVLYETVLNVSTLFHHSNLALPERWDRLLRTVLVTPNMHRVHHSVERAETDSNFTSVFSFWDRLFGTYRMRDDLQGIVLGLPRFREQRYQRLWGFLVLPFR